MSVISDLMASSDKAGDEYEATTVAVARAYKAERAAYHAAEANAALDMKSDAALERTAKRGSWQEKVALVEAENAKDAAAMRCRIVMGLLVAAQADAKWRGQVDGGWS